jgi:hypothetical protein
LSTVDPIHAPLDVAVGRAFADRYTPRGDPRVEIGTADGPVALPTEGRQIALADGVT